MKILEKLFPSNFVSQVLYRNYRKKMLSSIDRFKKIQSHIHTLTELQPDVDPHQLQYLLSISIEVENGLRELGGR